MNKERKILSITFVWLLAGLLQFPFSVPFFLPEYHYLQDHLLWSGGLYIVSTVLLFLSIPQRHYIFLYPFIGWLIAVMSLFSGFKGNPGELEEGDPRTWVSPSLLVPIDTGSKMNLRQRILKELNISSLAEVLSGNDIDLIRGAISRLGEIKTPDAIQLIQQQQMNPSSDVRFFATTILIRVKREFEEELDSAKQEIKKDINNLETRQLIAARYLNYARSHLLDHESSLIYLREAVEHLKFVLNSPTPPLETYWILIDTLMENGEWNGALRVLDSLGKEGLSESGEIMKKRCLIFFKTRSYDKLIGELQSLKNTGYEDRSWQASLDWWGIIS